MQSLCEISRSSFDKITTYLAVRPPVGCYCLDPPSPFRFRPT